MTILGAKKYYEVLFGESNIILIDRDIDERGNEMSLFETKEKDDIVKDKIQFMEVICPSTKRIYSLYPPNQKSINVWDAKASTFNNNKIQYRHGDVGLLNLDKSKNKLLIES